MSSKLVSFLGLTVLAACASSCSGLGNGLEDLRGDPGSLSLVPARTYQASLEEAQQAARFALEESAIELAEEEVVDEDNWYCLGEIGYSWRSNGQFMRVSVKQDLGADPVVTYVYYSSLRRFNMNVTEDLGVVRDKILAFMDTYIESL